MLPSTLTLWTLHSPLITCKHLCRDGLLAHPIEKVEQLYAATKACIHGDSPERCFATMTDVRQGGIPRYRVADISGFLIPRVGHKAD